MSIITDFFYTAFKNVVIAFCFGLLATSAIAAPGIEINELPEQPHSQIEDSNFYYLLENSGIPSDRRPDEEREELLNTPVVPLLETMNNPETMSNPFISAELLGFLKQHIIKKFGKEATIQDLLNVHPDSDNNILQAVNNILNYKQHGHIMAVFNDKNEKLLSFDQSNLHHCYGDTANSGTANGFCQYAHRVFSRVNQLFSSTTGYAAYCLGFLPYALQQQSTKMMDYGTTMMMDKSSPEPEPESMLDCSTLESWFSPPCIESSEHMYKPILTGIGAIAVAAIGTTIAVCYCKYKKKACFSQQRRIAANRLATNDEKMKLTSSTTTSSDKKPAQEEQPQIEIKMETETAEQPEKTSSF